MHFTREPILESIISARDGQKISVRRSSVQANEAASEEFIVDSVEVVSFGGNLFYRSLEKPKPFMLPATHYELVEVKETRIVLKAANLEKSIKIGGGKEQPRAAKEAVVETIVDEIQQEIGVGDEAPKTENVQHSVEMAPRGERKRDRRKRRRGRDDRDWQDRNPPQGSAGAQSQDESSPRQQEQQPRQQQEQQPRQQGGERRASSHSASGDSVMTDSSGAVIPPMIPFATLIPPPTTLISETLSRYKEVMFGEMNSANKAAKTSSPKEEDTLIDIEEVIYEEKKPEADENNGSDEPLTRLRLDESYFDKGGFGSQY